jgi:hypothetical protein
MLECITIGISIDRDWRDLYEAIWRPEAFPTWASGLSNASLVRQGEIWTGQSPEGLIQIRFTDRNEFRVMDHWVDLGGGRVVYVPLRILANGSGAEVLLTLFRQPDMSDAKFAQDQDWVRRDLLALKALAER